MENEVINVELYKENNLYHAYIGGDGDSGIHRSAETKKELAEMIKEDILDYLTNLDIKILQKRVRQNLQVTK